MSTSRGCVGVCIPRRRSLATLSFKLKIIIMTSLAYGMLWGGPSRTRIDMLLSPYPLFVVHKGPLLISDYVPWGGLSWYRIVAVLIVADHRHYTH
jgi:hypothetical protein